jgi:hypothetical protein
MRRIDQVVRLIGMPAGDMRGGYEVIDGDR